MPKGFVYILQCADGSYYTGSTIDIEKRLIEHSEGKGANHTKKRLPIKLVFLKEFQRIDDAFNTEKQIQGWSRKKKEALIEQNFEELKQLSECKNNSHYKLWHKLTSTTGNKTVASTTLSHQKSTTLSHQKPTIQSNLKDNKLQLNNNIKDYKTKHFQSNGKLLITAEYVVLDGAKALAVPTRYGQSLKVTDNSDNTLLWKSYDENNKVWFEDKFNIEKHTITPTQTTNAISSRLIQIVNAAKQLNPKFLENGASVTTQQDFNRLWGLGTSSTLINNIANWAKIDAYTLLHQTFGGSGYDIACAQHNTPITYQLMQQAPTVVPVNFKPSFYKNLYFVFLNKKQNSRDGIAAYRANALQVSSVIPDINAITDAMIAVDNLSEFCKLIDSHEVIISKLIKQPTVKSLYFEDFNGSIKSLGAWGGDFVLVASENDPRPYFTAKGFEVVINYSDMII